MTALNEFERPKRKRGFASMDPAKQREIARKGGCAAHAQGRAHEFGSDEARLAGTKGGQAVSQDRAHMAEIGRAGVLARARNRAVETVREDAGGTMTDSQGIARTSGTDARAPAAE